MEIAIGDCKKRAHRSKSKIITIVMRHSSGYPWGRRQFAVSSLNPVVEAAWDSNSEYAMHSSQTWDLAVWQRIEGRGYIARLEGAGYCSKNFDCGTYVGVGNTAGCALVGCLGINRRPLASFISACRDHDTLNKPV